MFKNWYEKAKLVGPEERSDVLRLDDGMSKAHTNCAHNGDTEIIDNVKNHFICYVNFKGTLYEVGKWNLF